MNCSNKLSLVVVFGKNRLRNLKITEFNDSISDQIMKLKLPYMMLAILQLLAFLTFE